MTTTETAVQAASDDTPTPSEAELAALSAELKGCSAEQMLTWTWERWGTKASFASSLGLEDQVLLAMMAELGHDFPVFTLDTGRIFEETYELIWRIKERYGITVQLYCPDADEVEEMVNTEGPLSFRQSVEQRKRCCAIRKLGPLSRALAGQKSWICGLRREQSVTRAAIAPVEWDGLNSLLKISPLAEWDEEQVWGYVHKHSVPYNPLHDAGYPSIGCSSCTRAVAPGEDARAGRWWWESPENRECGLHWNVDEFDEGSGI